MIRAFICGWSVDETEGRRITNPILSYLESHDIEIPAEISFHYAPPAENGEPGKPLVLVIARQESGVTNRNGQNIEALGNLSGVYMLPAYRFSKPITEIPANVRNGIRDTIVQKGIPLSALSGMEIYGDFLLKVAKYFDVNHAGFGRHYELEADTEFDNG